MRTLIHITLEPETNYSPKKIICMDKNWVKAATINCSGEIEFEQSQCFTTTELSQIKIIADNFNLFYDNIYNNQIVSK
jgi:hypothetical protein